MGFLLISNGIKTIPDPGDSTSIKPSDGTKIPVPVTLIGILLNIPQMAVHVPINRRPATAILIGELMIVEAL